MGKLQSLKPLIATSRGGMSAITTRAQRKTGSGLQAIRRRIFKRDGYRCICPDCKTLNRIRPATIVDHRIPLWAGGADDDHNRQSMHPDCHDAKSAHEAGCRARGVFVPWAGSANPVRNASAA